MNHTLAAIADALGAEGAGDLSLSVTRAVHPAEASGPDDLALAMDARLLERLRGGPARAAIVPSGTDWRDLGLEAAIFAGRARHAMAGVTTLFAEPPHAPPGIHPGAVIDSSAVIGEGASIGAFVWIGPGAAIGAGARIMAHGAVGAGARLGEDCLLHPGVRIGAGVTIGARVIVHMNAVIGADGFSFVTPTPGAVESAKASGTVAEAARNTHLVRIHSLGAVTVGDDVEIGAGACIDRGTVRDTVVGAGTKIDNLVQVGHNVRIGENCLICAQVGIAGSAVIGDRCVLGGKAGVADNARIGDDCVIGAASNVAGTAAARSVLLGSPALPRDQALESVMAVRRLPRLLRTVEALKKQLSALDSRG